MQTWPLSLPLRLAYGSAVGRTASVGELRRCSRQRRRRAAAAGIRWARNQGIHQLVSPQGWSGPGLVVPVEFPARFDEWQVHWLSRAVLPDEKKANKRTVNEREVYDAFLVGGVVRDTLQAAIRWSENPLFS
jgi:hypothetical protein